MNALQTGGVIPLRIINATGQKQQVRLFHRDEIPEGVTVKTLFNGMAYEDIKLAFIRENYLITKIRFSREKTFYGKPFIVKHSRINLWGATIGWDIKFKASKSQYLKNQVEKECKIFFDFFSSLTFDVDINITDIYLFITTNSTIIDEQQGK